MRLSLVSDASEAFYLAVSGLLPPSQQAADHERAAFSIFFCLKAPVGRVLFSMNYFDKRKLLSATRTLLKAVLHQFRWSKTANTRPLKKSNLFEVKQEILLKVWRFNEKKLSLQQQIAKRMKNVDYFEEQELEVMDYVPMTPEEAHLRIEEAELGIAKGEVMLHSEVIKRSYELLQGYGS
jgi:hypothetical protein